MSFISKYPIDHVILVLLAQRGLDRTDKQNKEFKRLDSIYERSGMPWFDICDLLVKHGYMDKTVDNGTQKYKTNDKGIRAYDNHVFISDTQYVISEKRKYRMARYWSITNGVLTIAISVCGVIVPLAINNANKGQDTEKIEELSSHIYVLERKLNSLDSTINSDRVTQSDSVIQEKIIKTKSIPHVIN